MIRTHARVFLPVLLLFACAKVAECVELADIFGPEMILQRDAAVPVWGTAEPGEIVTVTFAGQTKGAVADQHGRWSLFLDAMSASAEPRPLTVQVADEPVTMDNVRVGEVWLVLGLRVGPQYSAEGPVPRPNTRVRHFGAGRPNHSPIPLERFGGDRAWGPDRHQRFDVLSIPFANRLNAKAGRAGGYRAGGGGPSGRHHAQAGLRRCRDFEGHRGTRRNVGPDSAPWQTGIRRVALADEAVETHVGR